MSVQQGATKWRAPSTTRAEPTKDFRWIADAVRSAVESRHANGGQPDLIRSSSGVEDNCEAVSSWEMDDPRRDRRQTGEERAHR